MVQYRNSSVYSPQKNSICFHMCIIMISIFQYEVKKITDNFSLTLAPQCHAIHQYIRKYKNCKSKLFTLVCTYWHRMQKCPRVWHTYACIQRQNTYKTTDIAHLWKYSLYYEKKEEQCRADSLALEKAGERLIPSMAMTIISKKRTGAYGDPSRGAEKEASSISSS